MSDDGFLYFREWLVGKGRAAVAIALTDPDGLGIYVDNREVDNEGLGRVAFETLEERGVDVEALYETGSGSGTTGEPFDEETVDNSYPRLASAQLGQPFTDSLPG